MKLAFLFYPVKNLKESLTFYRDQLGFEEAWREGEHTVALRLPQSDVQLMIEDDELDLTPGAVFLVDSVDSYYEEHKDQFTFIKEPVDIPPGRYAIYKDPSGNLLRLIDFSNEK
ncbi:VOC family protein [Cytobacillus purgationiresistens]|uniref:Catechol 2,3-dioxygenase-like lactoylglutathione lyase family enzyme n=1 Tax=Cytobacillus purgationiresistens TaxID=863449 RepID=A0ABU0AH34_9BACI|nr:VOC family protein [Cytobacillus purgationiresistens]MDQ0270569.1 catechol 2,3-dioxygenase-like lactoylglutathione lyase family enzyme [Cytobacillus purgationiresistens]